MKTWRLNYELCQKAYSIESYNNLFIVTEKQALNPLWMLNWAGHITASRCYDVCHTDTGKISSSSLLATIMQYSETKSNKCTRYGNDNEFAEENILLKPKMYIMKIWLWMKLASKFTLNTHVLVNHLMVLIPVLALRYED